MAFASMDKRIKEILKLCCLFLGYTFLGLFLLIIIGYFFYDLYAILYLVFIIGGWELFTKPIYYKLKDFVYHPVK